MMSFILGRVLRFIFPGFLSVVLQKIFDGMINGQGDSGERKDEGQQGKRSQVLVQLVSAEYAKEDDDQHLDPDARIPGIIL